jgi:hypothetical protein
LANVARFLVPQSATAANLRFQFQKRRQLFVGADDEAPSVVAVRVNNPDCLPLRINR